MLIMLIMLIMPNVIIAITMIILITMIIIIIMILMQNYAICEGLKYKALFFFFFFTQLIRHPILFQVMF